MTSSKQRADRQTLTQLANALWEAAVVIKIRKKDLMKWPDDVEMLHQYRISIRVARSLVKFIKPYQKKEQNQELKIALKLLQDPTSRLRELDVLVPQLEEGSEVRALCESAQADTRAAFFDDLKADVTQATLMFVDYELREIQWKKSVADDGIDIDEIIDRIEEKRLFCEKTLATVDFDDQEAVHTLRKEAKGLRYVARELGGMLPEGSAEVSGQMRKVQDKLGEWCDARVNAALMDEICGAAGVQLAAQFRQQARDIMRELASSRG